jgi:DNA replication protein DnaC
MSRIDVVVIDDWAMAPLSEAERRDFREICEDRYQVRSLIQMSQLPVTRWPEQIGKRCARLSGNRVNGLSIGSVFSVCNCYGAPQPEG